MIRESIERREFFSRLGALPLMATPLFSAWVGAAEGGERGIEALGVREARDRATNGPHYWAWWGWEPWEHNRRAGGITGAVDGSSHWLHKWYARLHSEELVEKMAKAGVTLAVTHFFKGFGLRHERAEQQRTAELVRLAGRRGLRVVGYCQGCSLYYEALLAEEPGMEDWAQRDPSGKPVTWGGKYYRWCPCIHSRGFRDYLKRAIFIGLREVGLDGFNFDNTYSGPCYCPRCEKAFREWMVRRYPEPRDLFGLGTLEHVRQPPMPDKPQRITDPLTLAWIRWRCEAFDGFMEEITGYARELKPDAVLLSNPSHPVSPGGPLRRSVWPVSVGKHLNLMITENSATPELVGDAIISQVRAYKQGQAVGYRPVSTTWAGGLGREASAEALSALPQHPATVQLQVAEAAANRAVPGANWATRPMGGGDRMRIDLPELHSAFAQYLGFVRQHEDLWLNATPKADVAVLHSFTSAAFNPQIAWDEVNAVEEVFIRAGFSWGVVFDDRIGQIEEFSVLVLAGQTHLSAAACDAIKAFAAGGGGLLIVNDAAVWDENGQLCEPNPLDEVHGSRVVRLKIDPPQSDRRKGHVVCIPLPKQWKELAEAAQRLAGPRLSVRLRGPTEVAISLFKKGDSGHAIHLVNYAAPRPSGEMRVELGGALAGMRQGRLLTPEGVDRALAITSGVDHSVVHVPAIGAYGVIVVS